VEVLVELLGDAAVAAVERVPQVRTPVWGGGSTRLSPMTPK
jgi:hypothetical protein